MRIPRFGKQLLAAVLAVVGGLVIAGAASADSGSVGFKAQGPVLEVGLNIPMGAYTDASFSSDTKGRVRTIDITTVGEVVRGTIVEASCRPGDAAWCTDLKGSAILSVHESTVQLSSVELSPSPLGVRVASGKLKGSLNGAFGIEGIPGAASLEIRGSATYACLGPTTTGLDWVDVSNCDGRGVGSFHFMIPIVLDVKDHGTFDLGLGTIGSTTITGGEGHIRVDVSSNLLLGTLSGSINITEGVVSLP